MAEYDLPRMFGMIFNKLTGDPMVHKVLHKARAILILKLIMVTELKDRRWMIRVIGMMEMMKAKRVLRR